MLVAATCLSKTRSGAVWSRRPEPARRGVWRTCTCSGVGTTSGSRHDRADRGMSGWTLSIYPRRLDSLPLVTQLAAAAAAILIGWSIRARRGLLPAQHLPEHQRAFPRRGEEDRAQPAQLRRRLAPTAQAADHGRARARDLVLRDRPRGGLRARDTVGDPRMVARARLPDEPVRRAARVAGVGRPRLRLLGFSLA